MKFTNRVIKVCLEYDGEQHTLEVAARVCGPLAIHRRMGRYVITHIPTGRLAEDHVPTLASARRLVELLLTHDDSAVWDEPEAQVFAAMPPESWLKRAFAVAVAARAANREDEQ